VLSLRVLALHGKGGSGEVFRNYLSPLILSSSNLHIDWIFPDAPHEIVDNNKQGFAWWKLPEGVRSFDALNYPGIDASLDIIESHKPFDVILGHSQGAILSSIYLATSIANGDDKLPRGAILSGAAWASPYNSLLEGIESRTPLDQRSELHIIHTTSKRDKVNPYHMAIRLASVFSSVGVNEVVEHEHGHILPLEELHLEKYLNLFRKIRAGQATNTKS